LVGCAGVVITRTCVVLVSLSLAQGVAAQPAPASTITGRVLRPDGIPQPDAEVVLATRARDGRLRTHPWKARTAFDGRYEIRDVPAGEYLVLVPVLGSDTPMDGRPIATLFPGVASSEPGTPVHVYAGVPVEGVDIWLLPSPRRFQVAGRVVDHEARDLENVVIEFGRPNGRADNVWTLTEPGGLFALAGVPPGPIVMRAYADAPSGRLVGVASAELAIESPQDVRIVVHEPGRVRGRVSTPGGSIPTGLRVSLVPALLRPSALFPAEPMALDAAGGFELSTGPGEHEVIVEGLPPGFVVLRVRSGRSPATASTVWITAATMLDDVQVEIGPAPVPPRTGR
jgi:hypothetical protein